MNFVPILLIFIATMGVKATDRLEIEVKDFNKYVKETNKLDLNKCQHLMIVKRGWVIYPPGNRMPIDPEYFNIPEQIAFFLKLKSLDVTGVFVSHLPNELVKLKDLEYLHISLHPNSDLKEITTVLKSMTGLKKIDLGGSVVSKTDYLEFKKAFKAGVVNSLTHDIWDQ